MFPSLKMLYNCEKIDKNTHPPKGTRSGKQLFFPYPSVFAESYVRCAYGLPGFFLAIAMGGGLRLGPS